VTRLALLSPTTLLGKELIEKLDEKPGLWQDIDLLSLADDEIGALTDAAGGAAVVARAEPAAIAAADVLFVCGASATYRDLLSHRAADSTVVFLDPQTDEPEAIPIVAGVNLDQALPGRMLASPHPGVALLAHVLQPLLADGVSRAVATLVQPASLYDRAGLDELFAQAGRLVSLQAQEPSELFGRQLAFNLYPARRPPPGLAARARQVLGVAEADLPLAVHLLQGPVFHGFSALLHVHLRPETTADEVRRRLAASPLIELSHPDAQGDDPLGPIDVAARDEVLVGAVERDPDGGTWIWAVMDNLTRGGATNAVAILEQIAATTVH
jgi:aspartate-semialdehyde dehydrogenase